MGQLLAMAEGQAASGGAAAAPGAASMGPSLGVDTSMSVSPMSMPGASVGPSANVFQNSMMPMGGPSLGANLSQGPGLPAQLGQTIAGMGDLDKLTGMKGWNSFLKSEKDAPKGPQLGAMNISLPEFLQRKGGAMQAPQFNFQQVSGGDPIAQPDLMSILSTLGRR